MHHIATNKNQWSDIFRGIFKWAGLSIDSVWNKIRLADHQGPHDWLYHQYIWDRLLAAVEGLQGNQFRHALQSELWKIKQELMTPGSEARNLLKLP
ncbi:MAG: AHH domain-containing protein [Chloroflexi bacterium]|nr:AHH domain-containing protein [Chloroflexota bacterium]MCC6892909.1 AHH domain-containing protein [Anaerolineae bacterium]